MLKKELFTLARNLSCNELGAFLAFLDDLEVQEEDSSAVVAIAAVAAIYAINKKRKISLEDAVWELIENIIDKDNTTFLRLTRLKEILFSGPVGYLSISPETFRLIQEEAKLLLKADINITDNKRKYWESIINGELPPHLQLEIYKE